jgi:hypothetical protein
VSRDHTRPTAGCCSGPEFARVDVVEARLEPSAGGSEARGAGGRTGDGRGNRRNFSPKRKRHCRPWLCAAFVLLVCTQALVQSPLLEVERRGNRLHVSAPGLRFLEGRPLERLRDGASVTYVLALTVETEGDARSRTGASEKVVFSYDLWEERFAVMEAEPPGRSASHLTAAAAQRWCMDLFGLPIPAGPPSTRLVLKLECSVADEAGSDEPSGLSLSTLIDVLSRKARTASPRWEAVSRPLRLSDLENKVP